MCAFLQIIQSPSGTSGGIPPWLTSGPIPAILAILLGLVVLGAWVNFRLKRVQRDLHELGHAYYEKERIIYNDYKSGRFTEKEYRRKHEDLLGQMREESRKMTDGRR